MMPQPVPGSRMRLRALVTRPRADADGLARALGERGIEAVIEPMMDIRFRTEPRLDLAGVQAVLCTSANGVRALARLAAERAIPVLAVGDSTARRARDEGFVAVESAAGNVSDLARLARQRLQPELGPLLHVCGSAIAGDLAEDLEASGFVVDRAVLYEAAPVHGFSAAAWQAFSAGRIDFALFFSPRTAAIFGRLIREAGITDTLRRVTAVSISAAADAALRELPFGGRYVAATPDQTSLLAELDHAAAERCRR